LNLGRKSPLLAGMLLLIFLGNQKVCASVSGDGGSPNAVSAPKGPFEPTWDSIAKNYKTPQWFQQAKFGIFIHWGLYAVPAYHNEWYARHMYSSAEIAKWHTEHFGPQDKFGYKDFIPLFKAEKFNADQWAELFRKAGAKYVVPVAEHHDGFAMWDSDLTRWSAGKMGPKRDLIGELAKAVRKQGLVFGVSSHRMEHWSFMYPRLATANDLFDPKYADFYGPPHKEDVPESQEFLNDWLARCKELVDKYHPQLFYFDNGVNDRHLDAVKLQFAAYYYNRGAEWGKEVSITTKDSAYLAGNILDFEKSVRGPQDILAGSWQIDDVISDRSWGYVSDMKYRSPASIIDELADTVSKGGALMLNISPMADGTIPAQQQEILLEIGKWLNTNGDAIYAAKPWAKFGEGPSVTDKASPQAASQPPRRQPLTAQDFRFTVNGDTLYAIEMAWPGEQAVITSLAKGKVPMGKIASVTLLGQAGALEFVQDDAGLRIKMPAQHSGDYAFVFKITGLKLQ